MDIKNFTGIVFRGISQVFLLNNRATGILFLAGVFYNSWQMGVGALAGVLVGTFTALCLKYEQNDIEQGLYGYNSTLVSLATLYFFGFNVPSLIALFFGSILSTILRRVMNAWKLPPYTAPFILSTWILMVVILTFRVMPFKTTSLLSNTTNFEIIPAVSMGIGQVMFQENVVTGIIFFIGFLVCSRRSALYALLGSSLGICMSLACSFPFSMVNTGLFGFNAVLCGIALAGRRWSNLISALAAIVTSVFITYGVMKSGIISLTSPFVVSTWLALLLKRYLHQQRHL